MIENTTFKGTRINDVNVNINAQKNILMFVKNDGRFNLQNSYVIILLCRAFMQPFCNLFFFILFFYFLVLFSTIL